MWRLRDEPDYLGRFHSRQIIDLRPLVSFCDCGFINSKDVKIQFGAGYTRNSRVFASKAMIVIEVISHEVLFVDTIQK
jgi:hypothetical protein